MNKLIIVIIITCCFFTGCMTSWTVSNGSLLDKQSRYGIELSTPSGWHAKQINKTILFTRHGLSLECIELECRRWNDTLLNGCSLPQNMLLHEIPEILLGELGTSLNACNLTITSNEITMIDKEPCSLTKYEYTLPNSLNMQGILYCIPFKKSLTVLRYSAEKLLYFEKSYKDFVTVVQSIDVADKKYLPLPGISKDTSTITH